MRCVIESLTPALAVCQHIRNAIHSHGNADHRQGLVARIEILELFRPNELADRTRHGHQPIQPLRAHQVIGHVALGVELVRRAQGPAHETDQVDIPFLCHICHPRPDLGRVSNISKPANEQADGQDG